MRRFSAAPPVPRLRHVLFVMLAGCTRPAVAPPPADAGVRAEGDVSPGKSADAVRCAALCDDLTVQLIGLRSLLPPPPLEVRQPATPAFLAGVWRSGLNPAMQGAVVQGGLLEERIAFRADGRVCGVDRVLAASGGYYAFEGKWSLVAGVLAESYPEDGAPMSAGGARERRRTVVDAQRDTLLLEGAWPQRFERVSGAQSEAMGKVEGRDQRVAELAADCFHSGRR